MKNRNQGKSTLSLIILVTLLTLMLFPSCGQKKVKKPLEESKTVDNIPITEEDILDQDIDWSDKEKQAVLYKILMKEAEKYLFEENIPRTLAVYDRAFTIAMDSQKPALKEKIDRIFVRADISMLEELYNSGNLNALEPFFIYHLGLNYVMDKKYTSAEKILSSFEEKYPSHMHYDELCQLLRIARENMFNKDTIGCLLPLSGKYGKFGQKALSGIELALKDFQDKYNKKIVILIKDTGGDKKRAVECAEELCSKRVSSIIGPMVTALAVSKVAQAHETPMIAMTQKKLNTNGEKFVFSNFITPELQTKALVIYAFSQLKVKKFAIFYPRDRYGKKYMNLFWDWVNKAGGEVRAVESYNPEDTDFGTQLKKISGEYYLDKSELKGSKIDKRKNLKIDFKAIFIPDISSNIAQILPQLAYNDIVDVYLLGTKLWHRKNLLKDAEGYNKNSIIMEGYFAESKNKRVKKFTSDFTELYGTEPSFIEAIAYDTASMLFEILGSDEVNTKQELKDQIAGGKIFDGVTGRTYFDENGELHKKLYYLTIRNNKFVEIKR